MSGAADPGETEYILLPARGLRAARAVEYAFLTRFGGVKSTLPRVSLSGLDFLAPLADYMPDLSNLVSRRLSELAIHVIDSVREDGPKLARMTPQAAAILGSGDSGMRAMPVRYYEPTQTAWGRPKSPPPGAGGRPAITLSVRMAGTPMSGVKVVAFTSLAADEGAVGFTDAAGDVTLALGGDPMQLDSLYVAAPASGGWGYLKRGVVARGGDVLNLPAIAAPYQDCVRHACGPFAATDGAGVRVAVIDTGVGPHPDLTIAGGSNTVQGEPWSDFADNGAGHGTHVAGVIAGRPGAGGPMGVAPSAEIWSGRVYGAGATRASNYSIMKAMILATDGDCDLLNLSLSADGSDPVLQDAVTDAAQQGAVVLAAAGNGGVAGIAYPARCMNAVGVTAYGVLGAYPADTPHAEEVGTPQTGPEFFASFSNFGPETGFVGPGVGVISTALGGGYGIRSGTSQACAAVTGLAARLLGRDPVLKAATRDQARSTAIQNLMQAHATSLRFGYHREGAGRL